MPQFRWYSFSLRRPLVALVVICVLAVIARQYYGAKTSYELRGMVRLNMDPLSEGKVDTDAVFARFNVVAPGAWPFSGSAFGERFEVVGRDNLRCDLSLIGVTYQSWCRNKAELEQAKSELLAEIQEVLRRNQDVEYYGHRVIVITHPPFGENTIEELHDNLQETPVFRPPDAPSQTND